MRERTFFIILHSAAVASKVKAFAEWLTTVGREAGPDRNAEAIAQAVMDLVKWKKLNLRRGGYVVRRGRSRVIVERPTAE